MTGSGVERNGREQMRTPGRRGFLEICVESLAGARAAIEGGADQIELCSALVLGGLSPSQGLAETVMAIAGPAGVRVRAMVRPRAGGFEYDGDEMRVARAEAHSLLEAGVDGLVFGAMRGVAIDWTAIDRLRDALGVSHLTLHRAIDSATNPASVVEQAIAHGIDQILSSGGCPRAIDGLAVLSEMTRRAGDRCRIVAGAGVRPENASTFLAAGIEALHATARADGPQEIAPPDVFGFGKTAAPADVGVVRALRRAIDNASV